MEIKIVTGSLKEIEADSILIGLYEDEEMPDETAEIDSALGGMITGLKSRGEIKGKSGQHVVIHTMEKIKPSHVLVTGLGKRSDVTPEAVRGVLANACRVLEQMNLETVASFVPAVAGVSRESIAQAMVEGAVLGTYSFRQHKTGEAEHGSLTQLMLVSSNTDISDLEKGSETGQLTAGATVRARNMVNEPANFMTPTIMAGIAGQVAAENGLDIEVLEREEMKELGMGGLLGVAQGSSQPPKLIVLTYKGSKNDDIDIALVGKAITFDSGGISIKPSSGMEEMKGDMSGGAAVISAMGAIGALKPEINVVGIVPATENLPDGSALKPGDVISPMGGKTVEIISTDAEGRLALADAIGYAKKLEAKRIVDTATLTGAMMVALGDVCSGAFTNNQELADQVIAAGAEAGERIWQMPMYDDYKEMNKSDVADIKNVGGRFAGSITAAHFLGEFVDDVPWVHLDIAGTFMADKTKNYIVKGGTGIPVRTLINLVLSLAK